MIYDNYTFVFWFCGVHFHPMVMFRQSGKEMALEGTRPGKHSQFAMEHHHDS